MNEVLQWAVPAVSLILAAFVLYLWPKLPKLSTSVFNLLDAQISKIHNQTAQEILQRVSTMLRAQALKMEVTIIEDLKEMARDGRLTPDELKVELLKVKGAVLSAVQGLITVQGLLDALSAIFLGNKDAMAKWMSDELEAHVSTFPPSGLQTTSDGTLSAIQKGILKRAEENLKKTEIEKAIEGELEPKVPQTAAS